MLYFPLVFCTLFRPDFHLARKENGMKKPSWYYILYNVSNIISNQYNIYWDHSILISSNTEESQADYPWYIVINYEKGSRMWFPYISGRINLLPGAVHIVPRDLPMSLSIVEHQWLSLNIKYTLRTLNHEFKFQVNWRYYYYHLNIIHSSLCLHHSKRAPLH